ncbi:glycosyltransferase [Pseudotabrizicola algicola]|uniref:Glycosyltransferase n=1 Tax=Pseudotabrizicola algicola TaxID=2709381 RepID=A0A6B3RUY5_9RHOB|nr:glycosyltransferase [Pseudotabrizicola algicola]NEX47745.1 glycosyltransferase [Pseudotabrizicola algicola]
MPSARLDTPPHRILATPRNPWTRLLAVSHHLAQGDLAQARDGLDGLTYHPDLSSEMLDLWRAHLADAEALRGAPAAINRPADYLANRHRLWHPPFRMLNVARQVPKPYPWAMALPAYAGAGNDISFLEEAATALEPALSRFPFRAEVVWIAPPETGAAQLAQMLASLCAQTPHLPAGLTIFAPDMAADAISGAGQAPFAIRLRKDAPFQPPAQAHLADLAQNADLVLFLSGEIRLDPMVLARMARLARVSDRVALPLVPLGAALSEGGMVTPFTPELPRQSFAGRYPFRDVIGLNIALPARLLREMNQSGPLLDPRFVTPGVAARELAYRMHARGVWFAPVRVPDMAPEAAPSAAEQELYKALCPNHWDRKRDVWHEVSKVSVYIPAYNASKYIERAVESVLAQDVADLEVCIANDGSRDGTLALLERLYAGEPRVRWLDNPNGGIGFASNSAIRMSRSLYIGQLDSDDCLKPGAVRRLMTVLDENPSVVCAYGSCERIDAAGNYTQDEYAWPVFSREKMMITSIAHHFRMFRRQTWERTTRFREDIVNGVDYDIFLKMSELGEFRHVEEKLYQRRWHGENTSHVNEHHQTTNTHRVQREALARQGLSRFWDVHVPDPQKPRNVTYRRPDGLPMVVFWPDYSRGNPYQKLLYAKASAKAEVVAGDIDAVLHVLRTKGARPQDVVFHLHWLNALFRRITTQEAARAAADTFLAKLEQLRQTGARLVWTVHNTVSHDTPFAAIETDLSARIAGLADVIHLHCAGSQDEVAASFALPAEKVRISRHGSYIGAYPDYVSRDQARQYLGIGAQEDVILFTGLVRPYKGVEDLVSAFRSILADRPGARLIIAGHPWFDPLAALEPALTEDERSRVLTTGRFVNDSELQLFFRAADIAAYPYRRILTSGSLLLALSFGVPTVVPRSAMTAEVLEGQGAGHLYGADEGREGLEKGMRLLLEAKDNGRLAQMGASARVLAQRLDWPDFGDVLG